MSAESTWVEQNCYACIHRYDQQHDCPRSDEFVGEGGFAPCTDLVYDTAGISTWSAAVRQSADKRGEADA